MVVLPIVHLQSIHSLIAIQKKGEEDKEALAISGLFLDTLVHTIDIQVYENSNDIFRDLKIIYKIPEMMYRGNVEERGT